MKNLSLLFLLLLAQLVVTSQTEAQEKEHVFEVPLKYISFLLLNDSKSPLQLNSPRVLADEKGNLDYFYTISNSSDKSVKSFKIYGFDAFTNPSYEAAPEGKATDEFSFFPYESFSILNENKFEITEFTDKLAAKFKLSENHKRIWIVVVTKVELNDGTTYDATSKYTAIKKFIDQIQNEDYEAEDNDTPRLTAEEKETKLRNFIAEKVQKVEELRLINATPNKSALKVAVKRIIWPVRRGKKNDCCGRANLGSRRMADDRG